MAPTDSPAHSDIAATSPVVVAALDDDQIAARRDGGTHLGQRADLPAGERSRGADA
jgi:hypothetical protein